MAPSQTPLKLQSGSSIPADSSTCPDTAEMSDTLLESLAFTALPALPDAAPRRDGSTAASPRATGGSCGFATTALLSAFHADFELWASSMESSLHTELAALRHQVSASETVVSAIESWLWKRPTPPTSIASANTSSTSMMARTGAGGITFGSKVSQKQLQVLT